MSTNAEAHISRLKVKYYSPDEDSKFCLAQIQAFETADPDSDTKIKELLEGRIVEQTGNTITYACSIGGCAMQLAVGPDVGRKFTGECRAASYCLQQSFEAVKDTPTVEEGKKLYQDIVDSLDGFVATSVGNYCPRIECGLSAGLSEDMVPGTAGQCHIGDLSQQPQLPIDEA